MYPLPSTPSDTKAFQDKNPIRPEDTVFVRFDGLTYTESLETLRDTFNKHGKGKLSHLVGGFIVVKNVSWDIVNELRQRPNVGLCGPTTKGR